MYTCTGVDKAHGVLTCTRMPMQARFNVTITAPETAAVLFNTEATRSEVTAPGQRTHWHTVTPRMSTYLVAFVIGNLTHIEKPYVRASGLEVPVRAWGVPEREGYFQLALDTAVASLQGVGKSCSMRD